LLVAEVDRILAALPPGADGKHGSLREQATRVAIQRLLILDYLKARSLGATDEEVDLAVQRWRQWLADRNTSAADFYERTGMNEAAVRRDVAWHLGWPRYRARHLNRDALRKYFQEHQREFDGTRIKVAHLLLPHRADMTAVQRAAEAIRRRIEAEELTFDAAAEQYSQGKTANEGGVLGWITATGPMSPPFTQAAWQLDVGQISPPTASRFGVHLIKCLAIEPGSKQFAEVMDDVRRAVELRLFHAIADKQQRASKVERVPVNKAL
jgi:parvulin-like peptidyl-prolyl isomerase